MAHKYVARQRRRVYVKEWLAELDLNQETLAERMETQPPNVTRWLNDPQRITLDVLSGMADAMGRHVGDLFYPPSQVLARDRLFNTVRDAVQADKKTT